MVVIAEMNILAVGVNDHADNLAGLPVHLVSLAHGRDAARKFKNNSFDSIISHWHLPDMPDGSFIRRLRAFKSDLPIVAIIEANNPQQEIEARMLGVSAVIPEDSGTDFFRQVIMSVLGFPYAPLAEKVAAEK